MGCITGFVAKVFLTAFNLIVSLVGVGILAMAAIIATYVNKYGDLIPTEVHQILDALQSVSPLVMCLGFLGVLVACCCGNKLFLYTYFILGCCLVGATLTVAGIGTANMNNGKYGEQIKALMLEDLDTYNLNAPGEYETKQDEIYSKNECCGVDSFTDWGDRHPSANGMLPLGCCKDYPDGTTCNVADSANVNTQGCYAKLSNDVGQLADSVVKLSIFFGVLLFALLTSTCLCVKCTDAMPI